MTVQAPSILLLDEPTRGLDELSKRLLVACLEALRGEGVTIVMATHDVELVAACADRTVLLESGRVVAHGATGTVLQAAPPWRPQMLELLGDPRFLTVTQIRDALASRGAAAPDTNVEPRA
jgi:energy-coupling factor transport system ATP-binding protein